MYLRHLGYYLSWLSHYFTFPLLLKSFFAPWKRLVIADKSTGFNIQKYFEQLTFNLISRGIGAIVRLLLFWSGLILMALSAIVGSLGFVIWMIFPPLGYSIYLRINQHPKHLLLPVVHKIKASPQTGTQILFESEPGKYILDHLGLTLADISSMATPTLTLQSDFYAESLSRLMEAFVDQNKQMEDALQRRWIILSDFVYAAKWWDRKKVRISSVGAQFKFGRPGIGLELLFGYTPELNGVTSDMSAPLAYSHHLIGRGDIVERIERIISAGKSVVVSGQPGVGKKTVVLELARRAAWGELGAAMTYKRVLEFDYNAILSQSSDLNSKKNRLSMVLREAASAGNVILVIKDIQKLTNRLSEGYDFTEVFEETMREGTLKIIALSSNVDYERYIAPNMRLRKYLEVVDVVAPSKEDALLITTNAAERWEKVHGITITVPALRRIIEATDKYITEAPFPEKALDLLDEVVMYLTAHHEGLVTVEIINTVLSEKTGIPFARLTEADKEKLSNLEDVIHEGLINQETAVTLIAKSLRARSVGVKNEDRPIGSFLFLGPTGVGKTQTAKVLAKVYYGSESSILRFDMSEYAGNEGLARLIGSAALNQPGVLTTTIKNHPASLLLLDEIEKANPEIYNIFLTILDEGYVTDAFGRRIDCRHLFVIATSNAGAEFVRQQVSAGVTGINLQRAVFEYVQQSKLFTPEFLNRFDGVVVYEPLTKDDLIGIAKLILKELADNLKKQNIYLEITDDLARKVASDGYDPAYGARPMRRVVDLSIGDVVGKAILLKQIVEGDKIKIVPSEAGYAIEKLV